jgi:hypothetical protein
MILNKLLRIKKTFTKTNGETLLDLVSATFKFNGDGATLGPVVIRPEEAMRPDLLTSRIYGDSDLWDIILKFNGISNPFSLDSDEILLAPSANMLNKMTKAPQYVPEKGSNLEKKNEAAVVKPKSKKDAKRLEELKTKITEITPPNVNMSGEANVRIVNGRVIFGSNMTNSGKKNDNQSLARSRVTESLKNTNSL